MHNFGFDKKVCKEKEFFYTRKNGEKKTREIERKKSSGKTAGNKKAENFFLSQWVLKLMNHHQKAASKGKLRMIYSEQK